MNPFQIMRSSLPPEYISGGEVTKRLVFRSDDCEVALLEVAPNAKITMHQHTEDSELYFIVDDGICDPCPRGSSHYFTNKKNHTVTILSVKTTKNFKVSTENGLKFISAN